jgi:hypothetical protein
MKDKMGSQAANFPTGSKAGSGVDRNSVKGSGKSRKETDKALSGGGSETLKRTGSRSNAVQRTDRAPVSSTLSPIQALKATARKSVAKAAGVAGRKQSKKPRR